MKQPLDDLLARRLKGAHERYPQFFDYGDAEVFRQEVARQHRLLPFCRISAILNP